MEKFKGSNVVRPEMLKPEISTPQEAIEWVEAQSKREDLGELPEGFVLYVDCIPVAKMKNTAYLGVHKICTGNVLQIRGIVIERFFEGTLDDIMDLLSPVMINFVDHLKSKVKEILEVMFEIAKKIPEKKDPKQFSAYVKQNISKQYQSFFFNYDPKEEFEIQCMSWLKKAYRQPVFMTIWKDTNIKEIVEAERKNNVVK